LRVQAEPTTILLEVDGVPCRIWNAVTDQGEQVFLFVHRVAIKNAAGDGLDELTEMASPSRIESI
jgi:hypothetical protein